MALHKLKISYSIWKQVVQNNGFTVYQVADGENWNAVAGHRDTTFHTYVESSDLADYDANFKPDAITALSEDDALAQIVGLEDSVTEPRSDDGGQVFVPSIFPRGVDINYRGVGDDLTAGTLKGGSNFKIETSLAEDKTRTFRFIHWIYIAGATIEYDGATKNDHFSYRCFAPKTDGTSVAAGTGTHAKIAVGGGINMWVPVGTPGAGSADWDLDLNELENANVGFTKVVPVPASKKDGFFNWKPKTEKVTANATQTGKYNLFDSVIELVEFASEVRMLTDGRVEFVMPNIKPRRILAHWKNRITVHHANATPALTVVWTLLTAREKTI